MGLTLTVAVGTFNAAAGLAQRQLLQPLLHQQQSFLQQQQQQQHCLRFLVLLLVASRRFVQLVVCGLGSQWGVQTRLAFFVTAWCGSNARERSL